MSRATQRPWHNELHSRALSNNVQSNHIPFRPNRLFLLLDA
ncbi:hypothetical protein Mal15_37140 [Stieleria maiorica]|uniref:Uncharacterized protein n=1 Tax=Stieleria maiorica TaxID=2795974 RepID=A0A5B9MEX3_9BACT|nr:hypothetical protein Mal15_37140 [Stieleria maiorica]